MIVSEGKAGSMWCPKTDSQSSNAYCMPSSCMAWRDIGCDSGYCGNAGPPTEWELKMHNDKVMKKMDNNT